MKKLLKQFEHMSAGTMASIAFFFASMVSSGISYIVTPIYTRLLTPEVYGQTSIFLTWVQIFGIVAMFCLSYGVFNNGMIDHKEKRDEFSFSMLILSNVITIIFSLIVLSLYPMIKKVLDFDFSLLVLMCVLFFFQPAYNFWTARQRYELRYRYTVIWTIILALISPLVAIFCVLFWDDKQLYARIFGAEAPLILLYIGFYIYLAKKSNWKLETKYWKTAILFNLPLIPHYLSMYLLSNSNKLLISNIVGDNAVAYYSVAHSVASIVTIIWSSINASLVPYTYEKCKNRDYKAISQITSPILTAFALICMAVTMFAPEIVSVMATNDYLEAIYVIPPIMGGLFFQVQYFIYANIVYYYKKPKYVMFASLISVVMNLVIGWFLIYKFGYLAAGYTMLICYFLQALLDFFAMKYVVKENVYNMKHIGVLSFFVVLVSLLSNLFYSLWFVRYIIVFLLVVVAILCRKKLLSGLKNMRRRNYET